MATESDTLEQLEGSVWRKPEFDSYLAGTIHALRQKPIRQFTVEDLRISLGQRMGAEFLTPLALDRLEVDPFAEDDFYAGDLLVSVMDLPAEYWAAHPKEASRMAAIANRAAAAIQRRPTANEIKNRIQELLARASWRAA
jgi:CDI immunity proteins